MTAFVTVVTVIACLIGAWAGVGILIAWGHHVWRQHLARLDAYSRHPATRYRARLLATWPWTDLDDDDDTAPAPPPRPRRIPPCDCRGTLHDWSGVEHTPTVCTPLRERV